MTAFVTHTCKNSKTLIPTGKMVNVKGEMIHETKMLCFNGFMEEDTIGVTTIPSKAFYCPECVSKGFKNKHTRRKLSEEERLALVERLAKGKEKANSK